MLYVQVWESYEAVEEVGKGDGEEVSEREMRDEEIPRS